MHSNRSTAFLLCCFLAAAATAGANGKQLSARMLTRGGATMQAHVEAGLAETSLRDREVDVLVLQEQDGALLCAIGPPCDGPTRAHARLAAAARAAHARTILPGTCQEIPVASKAIEAAEAELARKAGIDTRVAASEAPCMLDGSRRRVPGLLQTGIQAKTTA